MSGARWEVDVMDATWIGAPASAVGTALSDRASWRRWWPDLDLELQELRGPKGVRWIVRSARGGLATGSMEIWLQPKHDGTVAHYFLRLNGAQGPLTRRRREQLGHEYRVQVKQILWAMADRLDPARIARLAGPPSHVP